MLRGLHGPLSMIHCRLYDASQFGNGTPYSRLHFLRIYRYAHQDKVDDAKLGLKSTALHFGEYTKLVLQGFAACAGMGWFAACYSVLNPVCALGLGGAYAHLVWQIQTAKLDNPGNSARRFNSNNTVGALVFLSIVAGNGL